MNLDQIYRLGFYAAITGCESIDECPYMDFEMEEKRAWVLGFIEGLRQLWSDETEYDK